jgi:class 3 adenylate cyclase
MFANIVGSTRLMIYVNLEWFVAASEPIVRMESGTTPCCGGAVDSVKSAAPMALFGARVALDNRAVQAATCQQASVEVATTPANNTGTIILPRANA